MSARRRSLDPARAAVLADATHEEWVRELGWIEGADLTGTEVPADLTGLQRALRAWTHVDQATARRAALARRVPHPVAVVLAVGAVAGLEHGAAVVLGQRGLDALVLPTLAAAILLGLSSAAARRVLGRLPPAAAERDLAAAALRRLGARSTVVLAEEQVIEIRSWSARLTGHQEAARALIRSASDRLREVDATILAIRSTNLRLSRPEEDPETAELAAVRTRIAAEVQGLTVLLAELDRRRAALSLRADAAATEAERAALSRRAAGFTQPGRPRPPEPPVWAAALDAIDAELAAFEPPLEQARARLTALEGTARAATRARS